MGHLCKMASCSKNKVPAHFVPEGGRKICHHMEHLHNQYLLLLQGGRNVGEGSPKV